jgi:hypothetical protein
MNVFWSIIGRISGFGQNLNNQFIDDAFLKFSNNRLPGKSLYGLMVNCLIISSLGGKLFYHSAGINNNVFENILISPLKIKIPEL